MPDPVRIFGSVTEHPNRSGQIRHRARLTINGKRESLGIYDTPEEAERVITAEIVRLGGDSALSGLTLIAWGERWLERRELDGLHRSIKSQRSVWRTRIATAPFARWPLRHIARTDIVRWLKDQLRAAPERGHGHTGEREPERKTSRQTVANALNLVRAALRDAADEGHIPSNPAEGVRVPKVPTMRESWTYLDANEIAALLAPEPIDATDHQRDHWRYQRIIFTVAIFTGLREGELWGLRWSDVVLDGARAELVVRHSYRGPTKGGRVRRVPLLQPAADAVREWRRVTGGIGAALVWPARAPKNDAGAPQQCHCKGYDAELGTALARTGIARRVRFHDLRHTCGSHLVMGPGPQAPGFGRTWSLREAQQWLGHKSITTTERYAHLAPEGLAARAAELYEAEADTKRTPTRGTERKK